MHQHLALADIFGVSTAVPRSLLLNDNARKSSAAVECCGGDGSCVMSCRLSFCMWMSQDVSELIPARTTLFAVITLGEHSKAGVSQAATQSPASFSARPRGQKRPARSPARKSAESTTTLARQRSSPQRVVKVHNHQSGDALVLAF